MEIQDCFIFVDENGGELVEVNDWQATFMSLENLLLPGVSPITRALARRKNPKVMLPPCLSMMALTLS